MDETSEAREYSTLAAALFLKEPSLDTAESSLPEPVVLEPADCLHSAPCWSEVEVEVEVRERMVAWSSSRVVVTLGGQGRWGSTEATASE